MIEAWLLHNVTEFKRPMYIQVLYMMSKYIVHLQEYVNILYITTLRYEVANMKNI